MKKQMVKKVLALALVASLVSVTGVNTLAGGATTTKEDSDTLPDRIGDEGCLTIPNTESSFSRYNNSFLSVSGFAKGGVNDRSEYVGTEYYRQVKTAAEFVEAIYEAQETEEHKSTVKVIEIMCDLNLGFTEARVDKKYTDIGLPTCIFSQDTMNNGVEVVNPLIKKAGGVSKIQIKNTNGLTIFSSYGATLNRTEFDITGSSNDIVIRNIKMDGSWQWDNHEAKLQKESGITYVKVNGTNVWIDHCEFTIAPDGCIDLENGANGITFSWCKFGMDPDDAVNNETVNETIMYMESLYQQDLAAIADGSQSEFKNCDINKGHRYRLMREAGATPEEIMQYTAYHSKVHLTGAGDHDTKTNPKLRLSLGYNLYESVGQRIPMIRQGSGHLYNCFIDNSKHVALENKFQKEYGLSSGVTGYTLTRCINARNGACIAADTCVYNAVNGAIVGKELQEDDTPNMSDTWAHSFSKTYNHALIVNSKVTNTKGETYSGSSWDNNGITIFTENAKDFWHDKSTIKKWAWSSTVTTEFVTEEYAGVFDVEYGYDEKLPYSYQLVPLEDVEKVVNEYSGMGVYDLTPEQWLAIEYSKDSDIKPAGDDKVYIANKVAFVDEAPVTYVGDKIKLDVVTNPVNVTNPEYTWSLKNGTGKATIDEKTGEITAEAKGKVTVTVKVTSINGTTVSKSVSLQIKDASLKPIVVVKGDFDNNGYVDLSDTLVHLKYALGINEVTDQDELLKLGDLDDDGAIGLSDVLISLKIALGIISL